MPATARRRVEIPAGSVELEVAAHVLATFVAPPIVGGMAAWTWNLRALRGLLRRGADVAQVADNDPGLHAFLRAQMSAEAAMGLAQAVLPHLVRDYVLRRGEPLAMQPKWVRKPPERLFLVEHVLLREESLREHGEAHGMAMHPRRMPTATDSGADISNFLGRTRRRHVHLLHIATALTLALIRLENALTEELPIDEWERLGWPIERWEDRDGNVRSRLRLDLAKTFRRPGFWSEVADHAEEFEEPARRYLSRGRSKPVELQVLRRLRGPA